MESISIVLFSKNRSCQTELCLRTLSDKFKVPCDIHIQYTYSDDFYNQGFEKLKRIYPGINFHLENGFQSTFKKIVSCLKTKHILFLVDDNVFINEVKLNEFEKLLNMYDTDRNVHTFSLRMNPTINYCFPAKVNMQSPNFIHNSAEYIRWNWTKCTPHYCWGYPHSIDSVIYNRQKFLDMVTGLSFHNVNSLEAAINRCRDHSKPDMISFGETKLWNVQNNFVQGDRIKESHHSCSVEELNKKFLEGKRISTSNLYGLKPSAAHGTIPYLFEDMDGKLEVKIQETPKVIIPQKPVEEIPQQIVMPYVKDSTKIGIFYEHSTKITGCYKVCMNLITGLKQNGIDVLDNKLAPMMNGCLQGGVPTFQHRKLPKTTLIGPEIMVLPTEQGWAFRLWKNWVQPSQWCIDYFKTFAETRDNNIFSWPVGIDTERFNDNGRGDFQWDCFVYYKDVTKQVNQQNLNNITNQLNAKNLKYRVLKYGGYKEEELIDAAKKSKFGIFLTGTESQGIAYLEVLAMGCPLYIIDVNEFMYKTYRYKSPLVSAAPYWDNLCGMKCANHRLGAEFDLFLNDLPNYQPRKYVVENHTLKLGAKKYLDIFEKL